MDQPVPKVGPEDVTRVLRRDFTPDDQEAIRSLFADPTRPDVTDNPRAQLAVLKVSACNVDRLLTCLEMDCRDVIAGAEYPAYSRVDWGEIGRMSKAALAQVIDGDWRQYQEWLTRT